MFLEKRLEMIEFIFKQYKQVCDPKNIFFNNFVGRIKFLKKSPIKTPNTIFKINK